jgi:hypothetical protein
MSRIEVYSELILRRDQFLSEIRFIESEVTAIAQRIRSTPIEIPIKADDQLSDFISNLQKDWQKETIRIPIMPTDVITPSLELIREKAAANPVVVPVVYEATGGVPAPTVASSSKPIYYAGGGSSAGMLAAMGLGAGAVAGGAAANSPEWLNDSDVVGESAGQKGFFSSAMSRQGAFAGMIAIHGLQRLATEINESEKGWGEGVTDPKEMLALKRAAIEREHGVSVRGAANWLYSKLGLQPSYDDEIAQLNEAQREMTQSNLRGDPKLVAQRVKMAEQSDFETSITGMTGTDRQRAEIEEGFKHQKEAVEKISDAWQKFGYRTKEDADKAVQHLEDNLIKIRDNALAKLDLHDLADRRAERRAEAGYEESIKESDLIKSRQPHAASISRRVFAIDQRVQQLQDAYDTTPEGPEKQRLGRQLDQAKLAAEYEKRGVGYTEDQRIEDTVSGFDSAARRSRMSVTPNDYTAGRSMVESEWNRRIGRIEDAPTREAAKRARDADLEARDKMHARQMEDDSEDVRALNLRAGGFGGVGDVVELAQRTKDDLEKAGDDKQARAAVLKRAEAQAQAMASSMLKPRVFGSWEQFQSAVMQGAMSGSGDALKQLQDLFSGIKRAEGEGDKSQQDKVFNDSVSKLDKAADKLIKSNVLILRDT